MCCARCHWRCLLDVQFANAIDALQTCDDVEELKLVSCGSERPVVALNKHLSACNGPYFDQHCIPANAYTSTYTALQQKQVRSVSCTLWSYSSIHTSSVYDCSTAEL
jgi:hypothetical protein